MLASNNRRSGSPVYTARLGDLVVAIDLLPAWLTEQERRFDTSKIRSIKSVDQ